MKNVFLFFVLFLFALPCFAVPGEYKITADGTKVCDNSDLLEYMHKLEKEFYERHSDGKISNMLYNKEVMIPYLDFSAKLQKQGHCGFPDF